MYHTRGSTIKNTGLIQPSSPPPNSRRLASILQRSPNGDGSASPAALQSTDGHTVDVENEDGIFSDGAGVKVVVRVRPHNSREHPASCISILPPNDHTQRNPLARSIVVDTKPRKKQFTYDFIAGEHVTQRDMFEQVGRPIINSCIAGYNGTVFAYGQTGSGKTYTMSGNLGVESEHGLIPRMLTELFSQMQKRVEQAGPGTSFLCKCSYLEIYNERITDLLCPDLAPITNQQQSLQLREDIRNGVFVEGLSQETASSANEALQILRRGIVNRQTSATLMNEESSRSHSVFTVVIQSKTFTASGLCKTKTSHLNLVDLAGSERQQSTKAEGDRLVEACAINKSLSVLAKVIMDITSRKNRHVHYRDSKLTFLLKDSLGGNSKTCIIANISPSLSCMSETVSTLQFAQRAKKIRNQPMVNEDMSGNIQLLQQELRFLRNELAKQKRLTQEALSKSRNSSGMMDSAMVDDDDDDDVEGESKKQHDSLKRSAEEIRTLEDLYLNSMEMKETSDKRCMELQKWIDDLERALQGKDHLLQCTRFMLKLKENKLASLEGRHPDLTFNFDELTEESESETTDDDDEQREYLKRLRQFLSSSASSADGTGEFSQSEIDALMLDTRSFLMKHVLHPDMHPYVLTLAVENLALREQLDEYDQQYGKDMLHENNMEIQRMKLVQQTLNVQVKQLVMEKHELQKELALKESDMEQMKVDFQTSQAEQMTQLETRIEELEQMNRELEQIVAAKSAEIEQLQLTEQRAWQLERELSLQGDKFQVVQQRLEESRDELSARQKRIEELQRLNEESEIVQRDQQQLMREQQEKYESDIQQLKSQFEQQMGLWQREMDALKAAMEGREREFNETMQQATQSFEQQLTQLRTERDALQQNGMEQHEQLTKTSADYARTKEELSMLQSHLESLQKHQAQQLEELRARLTAKQEEMLALQAQLRDKQDASERDEDERSMQQRQIERLCEQLAESNSKWRDAEARLEILEQREASHVCDTGKEDELRQQLEKMTADNERLRSELSGLTRQMQEFEQRVEELHNSTLEKEQELNSLRQLHKQLQQEYQQQQQQQQQQQHNNNNNNTEQVARVEAECEPMDERPDDGIQQNAVVVAAIQKQFNDRLDEHEKAAQAREKEMEEQLSRYKAELDKQISSGERDKARISALLADIDKHRSRNNSLSKDIANMRNRVQELEEQNARLIGHQNPKQKIQSVQRIKEENNALRREKFELQSVLQERENLLSRMRVELTRAVRSQGQPPLPGNSGKENAANGVFVQLLQEINKDAPRKLIDHEAEKKQLMQVVMLLASASGIQDSVQQHLQKSTDAASFAQAVQSMLAAAQQQRQVKRMSVSTPGTPSAIRRRSIRNRVTPVASRTPTRTPTRTAVRALRFDSDDSDEKSSGSISPSHKKLRQMAS